jgi:hypothetical protein
MSREFEYKPKFRDMRVRPPKEGEKERENDVTRLKPGEKKCDWPDCIVAGQTKAPKSRDMLNDHYWFCVRHAGEYNKNWDFFAGMTEADVRKAQEDRFTGGRPTWSFKASRNSREAAAKIKASGPADFSDPLGVFSASERKAAQEAEQVAHQRKLGKIERAALSDLDMDAAAEPAAIRARYTELLRRFHPDLNAGDRGAEGKLQRVIKAYKTLKAAGLA